MNFETGYNLLNVEQNRATLAAMDLTNHPFADDKQFRNACLWLIGRIHIDNPVEFQLAASWVNDWTAERSRIAELLALYEDSRAMPPSIPELWALVTQ